MIYFIIFTKEGFNTGDIIGLLFETSIAYGYFDLLSASIIYFWVDSFLLVKFKIGTNSFLAMSIAYIHRLPTCSPSGKSGLVSIRFAYLAGLDTLSFLSSLILGCLTALTFLIGGSLGVYYLAIYSSLFYSFWECFYISAYNFALVFTALSVSLDSFYCAYYIHFWYRSAACYEAINFLVIVSL